MSYSTLGHLVLASFGCFLALNVTAQTSPQENTPSWVIYRGDDGLIVQESEWAALAMYEKAQKQGYITLWLLLDEKGRPAASARKNDSTARTCEHILRPLVTQGIVWHPTQGPTSYGSSCLVRASADGVKALFEEPRFRQIMGSNPPFQQ